MRSLRYFLAVLALACVVPSAVAQTVSGRSFITGFELGSLGESGAFGNGGSVQSVIKRSGNYAYEAHPSNSNQYIAFASRSSGGVLRQVFKSSRFYLYVGQLPISGSVAIVKVGGAGTLNPEVDLNSDGTLTLADAWYPVIARSTLALSPDGMWHRIDFDAGYGAAVYVDGVLWAKGGTTTYAAGTSISFGAGASPTSINTTADLYFDDILVDSGSFSTDGFPADGHVVLLKPVSDPLNLNSWTGGAGSTASVYMNLKNVPPAGLQAAKATNTSQAKNGSNHSNQDYKPTVQSYLDAGVPAGSTINAVMAIANDGLESTKGSAKTGSIWIDGNPAQTTGYSFDFGDNSSVIGNFPSGWASHYGPVSTNPVVSLSAAPVVGVRKSSGSNVDVDFLGVYVDYK
jgi:hypothetical protein